jgi:pSer/pThr/pTyr-binding forkhead associated (FHA) protein
VGFTPYSLSPAELEALLAAERAGGPFLGHREPSGDLRLTPLRGIDALTVGRAAGNDLVIDWDPQLSRTHAQLERVGATWTLVDDGLSRNGCFVNAERIQGRRPLRDGDMLKLGRTTFVFRAPDETADSTAAADPASLAQITKAERRVLVELCRPVLDSRVAAPATNAEIARRLYLSEAGVKTHIRALFAKLEIEDLPQNRKRGELVRRALDSGLVTRGAVSG